MRRGPPRHSRGGGGHRAGVSADHPSAFGRSALPGSAEGPLSGPGRPDDGTRVGREELDLRNQFESVLSQLDATARWTGMSGHDQERWLSWVATPRAAPREPPKVRMYEAAHRLARGKPPPGRWHSLASWVRSTLGEFGFS